MLQILLWRWMTCSSTFLMYCNAFSTTFTAVQLRKWGCNTSLDWQVTTTYSWCGLIGRKSLFKTNLTGVPSLPLPRFYFFALFFTSHHYSTTWTSGTGYFSESKKIKCGSSRSFSQLIKVHKCQQDTITSHHNTCHPSKSELSEAEPILSRDGDHWPYKKGQVGQMVICFPGGTPTQKWRGCSSFADFGLT